MCGIIGIVGRTSTRPTPSLDELLIGLDTAIEASEDLPAATAAARSVDRQLRGVAGVRAILSAPEVSVGIIARLDRLDAVADASEAQLDRRAAELSAPELEQANAEIIALRDALWAIRNDRLRMASAVAAIAGVDVGTDASAAYLAGYLAIERACTAIDRLEVRGRDSAGVHVYVWNHDLDDASLEALLAERGDDPLFRSGAAVAVAPGVLSFVYKTAAEIGELGDNTAAIRRGVVGDELLRRVLRSPDARIAVLGHTRWASVGIISEPNTHPLNSVEAAPSGLVSDAGADPYVVAALNGDVDNHADLRVEHHLAIPTAVTTDAKIIPTLVARRLRDGVAPVEAFRRTVAEFDGSVAIGAAVATDPGRLFVALRGSGQGLYVGFADDAYVVASEPYGVVEESDRYLRLDGEHGGEIVVLDGDRDGPDGLERLAYDGIAAPVTEDDVAIAEVTTRDIDRGSAPHYLLKEITESPMSLAKTLRGKIESVGDELIATVGDMALPTTIAQRLANGTIMRVRVIGQGTAAVAGQSTAALLDELTDGALDVDAITATELSGFAMRLDMSDTLAI
ncbi:MAG: glucosamine-6-phosphate synthase, partial [Actinomycetota bacterium]